jgi:hypothetical protein
MSRQAVVIGRHYILCVCVCVCEMLLECFHIQTGFVILKLYFYFQLKFRHCQVFRLKSDVHWL